MEIVNELTEAHLSYWSEMHPRPAVFTGPQDPPGCEPCAGVVTYPDGPDNPEGTPVVRVAWKPSEIDLAHLARGGTIWLSAWHGLPPHMLEVQPPA